MSGGTPEGSFVRDIRVVVQKTGAMEGGRSVNHWSIYLLLEGDKSVRLNMREKTSEEWPFHLPEDAEYGEPGTMEITVHNYLQSFSTISYWDYQCTGQHTVGNLINHLFRKHYNYYTMAIGGSGCRYWVYVVMADFTAEGFVGQAVSNDVYTHMMNYYTKRGDTVITDPITTMPQGRFWTPESWADEFRTD
ncbi:hypothetical protein TWF506_006305 [Arthrobotrys conoides]|uniref:DUF7770 domain-containing protein n=1 Tax=Arthrobotrys conoides TaxID=74498 RepID=A0AAN8NLT5_9PEZI